MTLGEELLNRVQVTKAVSALVNFHKDSEKNKKNLFDSEKFFLQFGYKKIPKDFRKYVTIPLQHPLSVDKSEVCLIVKDLDKKERDYSDSLEYFKALLTKNKINCVGEVIPLKSLRLEYRPYEAKRRLAERFTLFLADSRIMFRLPEVLGKHFYGKKKAPVSVNLEAKNLAGQFKKVLGATRVEVNSKGSSGCVQVGSMGMKPTELVDNVLTAAVKIAKAVPGGAQNVRSFYIRSSSSPAVPVYMSTGSLTEVVLPDTQKEKPAIEPEEVTTIMGAKVIVTPSGDIQIIKDPNSSDVDSDLEEELDDEDEEEEGDDDEGSPKPKKAKPSAKSQQKEKVKKHPKKKTTPNLKTKMPKGKKSSQTKVKQSKAPVPPTHNKRKRKLVS